MGIRVEWIATIPGSGMPALHWPTEAAGPTAASRLAEALRPQLSREGRAHLARGRARLAPVLAALARVVGGVLGAEHERLDPMQARLLARAVARALLGHVAQRPRGRDAVGLVAVGERRRGQGEAQEQADQDRGTPHQEVVLPP